MLLEVAGRYGFLLLRRRSRVLPPPGMNCRGRGGPSNISANTTISTIIIVHHHHHVVCFFSPSLFSIYPELSSRLRRAFMRVIWKVALSFCIVFGSILGAHFDRTVIIFRCTVYTAGYISLEILSYICRFPTEPLCNPSWVTWKYSTATILSAWLKAGGFYSKSIMGFQ